MTNFTSKTYTLKHGPVQQFEQGIICRKNRPVLCYFSELPIEVLYRIRGINQLPNLCRILEINGNLQPIIVP